MKIIFSAEDSMRGIRFKQRIMIISIGFAFFALCIIGGYSIILPAFVCLIYGLIEPYCIERKETYFYSDKIPKSFENFKIVFVSDIHHGIVYSGKRLKTLVNQVNALQPDLILLGGDYIDQHKYIPSCFDKLKGLCAGYGVYGVLGNHDYCAGSEAVREAMHKAGIICLDNCFVYVKKDNDKIQVGGIGDYWNDPQNLSAFLEDIKADDFVMLLSHNPDYVEKIRTNKVDLVLSGHTHGGQATFFGLWAPFIPSGFGQKYRTGLIETPYTKVLVTNGIGNVGCIPIRFFARPQINIIYLKNNSVDD